MHVQMNFSKKTTNHLADPEIGFYVCVRLFLKVGTELAHHGTTA